MNEKRDDVDPLMEHSRPAVENSLERLFGTGILGWLAGMVILFGASWFVGGSSSLPEAFIWMLAHGWMAFLFGFGVLLLLGCVDRSGLERAAWAYLLPVALLAGVAMICLTIYPSPALREEFLAYLPMVLVFYLIGWLWMRSHRAHTSGQSCARAALPALLGGLTILGMIAVPAFRSDAFRYRDAFGLTIVKVESQDGRMLVSAMLEIRKPGNYAFAAPREVWDETSESGQGGPSTEQGIIVWGNAGPPQAGRAGVYPLRISWNQRGTDAAGFNPYDDCVYIEVRQPERDGRVIHSILAPLPES